VNKTVTRYCSLTEVMSGSESRCGLRMKPLCEDIFNCWRWRRWSAKKFGEHAVVEGVGTAAGNLCTRPKLCDVQCCSTFLILTDLLTKNCKDNVRDFVSRTRTRTRTQVTRIRKRTSPSRTRTRTCCWSLRSP